MNETSVVPTIASSATSTEKVTAETFIAKWPLHAVAHVNGFSAPERISFECDGACGKETTWTRVYNATELSAEYADKHLLSVRYLCLLCHESSLTVTYRVMATEKRPGKNYSTGFRHNSPPPAPVTVVTQLLKIGQYPDLSLFMPKNLAKMLGKDAAALYRKGLINRHHGYGLGATVYIRRVVEDKTNELIEVAAQLAESHGIDTEIVAQMRAAANSAEYTTYEDKLRVAGTVFPDNLKVGSINPLKVLYGLVSKGIHALSETECIEIFDRTTEVFEFVFTNLKAEATDRKSFEEKVKKLVEQPKRVTSAAKETSIVSPYPPVD